MLIHKSIIKQSIVEHIEKSFAKLPLNWSNIGNIIGANYLIKNKLDIYITPFLLQDEMINIEDLENLFLENIEKIKQNNPSLIGVKGELYRIPMLGNEYIITEQEVRDLIQLVKSKVNN